MSKFVHRPCPLCEKDHTSKEKSAYSKDRWIVKECDCGFVYLENALYYDQFIAGDAEWSESFKSERKRREMEEPIFKKLSKWWKLIRYRLFKGNKQVGFIHKYCQPGIIIDVGCGRGENFISLDNTKYTPYGTEISTALAQQALKHIRDRFKHGNIIKADSITGMRKFDDNSVSGIIMGSYLEHEICPQTALKEAFRVLTSGGHLIIKVPNYGSINRKIRGKRWCGFRFPDHVNYFTNRTLAEITASIGFRVVKSCHLPTSDSLWMVVTKP